VVRDPFREKMEELIENWDLVDINHQEEFSLGPIKELEKGI
jgi:hypothetical protein